MADRRDYVALEWVKGEIDETLKQARYALEAFVDTPDDTTRLDFSLSYIHQVQGTLQMVEFYGAALLAEEMEHLNQAIVDGTVPASSDNLAVLMQAIIQLPSYLDQIGRGQTDMPIVILPILNDLRAARGEKLLSETSLFNPDMGAARRMLGEPDETPFTRSQTTQLIRKLRQMYQLALLGWIKGEQDSNSIEFLAKSVSRVAALTERTHIGALWRALDAFVTAVKAGLVERSPATVKVMRDIDHAFKALLANPLETVKQSPNESQLKNTLFYLAKLGDTGIDRISNIQRNYKLVDALPSDQEVQSQRARLAGPDREAVGNVVTALLEELARLKDALDLMVRTQVKDSQRLSELSAPLQQLCDTMAVVGLANPHRVLSEQMDIIKQAQEKPQIEDDGLLMDIAGALLYVEATLSGIVEDADLSAADGDRNANVSDAHEAVLREARNGIEQVKDAVVEYIGSHFDSQLLNEAPSILSGVRGGLVMVPLYDASRILKAVEEYVQTKLINDRYRPQWQEMDALADALVGVEYYLERLSRDGSAINHDILERAGESLSKLGLQVILTDDSRQNTEESAVTPAAAETDEPLSVDEDVSEPESLELAEPDDSVELPTADVSEDWSDGHSDSSDEFDVDWSVDDASEDDVVIDFSEELSSDSSEEPWDALPVADLDEPDFEDTLAIDQTDFGLTVQADEPLPTDVDDSADSEDDLVEPESTPEVAESLTSDAADQEAESTDDDLIDDDILEIFIEEAGEVLEAIETYFPKYKADANDTEALTEFRRAFHTLKGSGRMVGATIVGETAWAVENMLNRLIDGSIDRSDDLVRVVEEV
ncbi:Hpt domain-containing protein, partial [Reinekea blandensis]